MKKFLYINILLFSFLGLFTSCEEVITLKLDTQEKQLVIDANISWKKGEEKAFPIVRLSYTKGVYDYNTSDKISDAIVKITSDDNEEYLLEEVSFDDIVDNFSDYDIVSPIKIEGSIYIYKGDFIPVLGRSYYLEIVHNGEKYSSKEQMLEVPIIKPEEAEQNDNGGVIGNEIEVKFFFDGFPNQTNNYLIRIKDSKGDNYFTLENKFLANNKFFFITSGKKDVFTKGSNIDISIYRISPDYQQIVDLLIANSVDNDGRGGPPIFSIPSRVFGNIVHHSDPQKNPLGAFRVAQYSQTKYTIK